MIKETPLIYSPPMAKALKAGIKTQTRRLPTPMLEGLLKRYNADELCIVYSRESLKYDWIMKQWRYTDGTPLLSGLETPTPNRWPTGSCPSIHQPRAISRFVHRVKRVWKERLQDISEEDALSEGITMNGFCNSAVDAYMLVWKTLHGIDSWTQNPEIIAIEFDNKINYATA